MVTLLTIISLILWAYIIAKTKPGIDFTKLITFTACGFFFSYTIISACFFWLDCFSFVSTLFAGVVLELVVIFAGIGKNLCSGHRYDRRSLYEVLQCQVTFDFHRYWIPIVIALLALPFTWNKFGLYSMGQDQGTYQVKALALMEYDTHNYMEMEEFTKLDTPDEKQKYLDFVYGQNNL